MGEDFGYGVFDLDEIKKKLLKSGNVIDVIYYMRHYRHLSIEFWNFFIYKMKFDGNDLYKIMQEVDEVRARAWEKYKHFNPSLYNLISLITKVEWIGNCQHIKKEAWNFLKNNIYKYKNDDNFKKYIIEIMHYEDDFQYEAWELLKSHTSLTVEDCEKIICENPDIRDSAYKKLLDLSNSEETLLELFNITKSYNFHNMNYPREDFIKNVAKKILNSNPRPIALFCIIKDWDCPLSFRKDAWIKLKNSENLSFLIRLLFCWNIEKVVPKKYILEILFDNEDRLKDTDFTEIAGYCHNNNLDSLKIRAAKIAYKKGASSYWLWKDFGINKSDLE